MVRAEVPVAQAEGISKTMDTAVENQERKLTVRAREGDVQAFGALVALYQERSIRLAYSLLGNWEDSRDAAQEAFVKAYQALKSFKSESLFSTWFYRILVNHCRDFQRRRKVRSHLAQDITGFAGEDETPPENRIPSVSPDPLARTLDRELETRIREDLKTLPERQRTVFSLRYFDGMTLHEIAQTLMISEGAVKAHLWQAGEKMKSRLSDYLEVKGVRP